MFPTQQTLELLVVGRGGYIASFPSPLLTNSTEYPTYGSLPSSP